MTNTRNLGDIGRNTNIKDFGEAFSMPTVDGANGQILATDGAGNLDFVDAGLTQEQLDTLEILQDDSAYFYTSIGDLYDLSSPKGPTTSIQINDDGVFGGYSSLTYNSNSETLSANNISLLGDLTVSNNVTVSNNISVQSLDASGDVSVTGSITVGDINTYSIDAIHDRGQLNSSDSAYFYTKLEEIEERTSGLELLAVETVTASVNAVDIDLPAGYSRFKIMCHKISQTGATYLWMSLSYDGGSTFPADSNVKVQGRIYDGNDTQIIDYTSESSLYLTHLTSSAGSYAHSTGDLMVDDGWTALAVLSFREDTRAGWYHSAKAKTGSTANSIRIRPNAGTLDTGTFALYGYKETL